MTQKIPIIETTSPKNDQKVSQGKQKSENELPFDDLLKTGFGQKTMQKVTEKVKQLNIFNHQSGTKKGKQNIPLKAKPILNTSKMLKKDAETNSDDKSETLLREPLKAKGKNNNQAIPKSKTVTDNSEPKEPVQSRDQQAIPDQNPAVSEPATTKSDIQKSTVKKDENLDTIVHDRRSVDGKDRVKNTARTEPIPSEMTKNIKQPQPEAQQQNSVKNIVAAATAPKVSNKVSAETVLNQGSNSNQLDKSSPAPEKVPTIASAENNKDRIIDFNRKPIPTSQNSPKAQGTMQQNLNPSAKVESSEQLSKQPEPGTNEDIRNDKLKSTEDGNLRTTQRNVKQESSQILDKKLNIPNGSTSKTAGTTISIPENPVTKNTQAPPARVEGPENLKQIVNPQDPSEKTLDTKALGASISEKSEGTRLNPRQENLYQGNGATKKSVVQTQDSKNLQADTSLRKEAIKLAQQITGKREPKSNDPSQRVTPKLENDPGLPSKIKSDHNLAAESTLNDSKPVVKSDSLPAAEISSNQRSKTPDLAKSSSPTNTHPVVKHQSFAKTASDVNPQAKPIENESPGVKPTQTMANPNSEVSPRTLTPSQVDELITKPQVSTDQAIGVSQSKDAQVVTQAKGSQAKSSEKFKLSSTKGRKSTLENNTQKDATRRSAQIRNNYGLEAVRDRVADALEENPADELKQQLKDRIEVLKKAQTTMGANSEQMMNQGMHKNMSMKASPGAGIIQDQNQNMTHPRVNAPLFARTFAAEMVEKIREITSSQTSAKEGTTTTFKVDAGQMGNLDIEFHQESSKEQITIFVDSDISKNDLLKVMPQIEENLQHRGFNFSGLDVEVKDNSGDGDTTFDSQLEGSSSNDDKELTSDQMSDDNDKTTKRNYGYNTMEVLA